MDSATAEPQKKNLTPSRKVAKKTSGEEIRIDFEHISAFFSSWRLCGLA
jgi:hypothetical protein